MFSFFNNLIKYIFLFQCFLLFLHNPQLLLPLTTLHLILKRISLLLLFNSIRHCKTFINMRVKFLLWLRNTLPFSLSSFEKTVKNHNLLKLSHDIFHLFQSTLRHFSNFFFYVKIILYFLIVNQFLFVKCI